MKRPGEDRPAIYVLTAALVAGVFGLELATHLGTEEWVLYFIPLTVSLFASRPIAPVLIGFVCAGLVVAGYFLSANPEHAAVVPLTQINRALGSAALIGLGFVGWRFVAAKTRLELEDWIKDGQVQLSARMRGERDLDDLGRGFLSGLAEWQRALASRTPAEFEYRLRRREGHFTWTLARVAPVFDDRGQLVEWIGANTDIDARKEAESVRETFVAILGHDLRNPVAAIQMWTQLVLSRSDPLDHDSIRYPLERVVMVTARMLRMIAQLLDLTRMRHGDGIAPVPTAADMEAIVAQALVENVTGRERFRIEAIGAMAGTWDVDRMYQVVSNLTRNALEHGAPGTPVRVRLDGSAPDTFQLTVQNVGPAVPSNLRDVIFEPFRGSKTRRRDGSRGLGLGLFITKQIVLAHGGTISFETGDAGTTFTVKLPRFTKRRASEG